MPLAPSPKMSPFFASSKMGLANTCTILCMGMANFGIHPRPEGTLLDLGNRIFTRASYTVEKWKLSYNDFICTSIAPKTVLLKAILN